jgi:hypothetical protein
MREMREKNKFMKDKLDMYFEILRFHNRPVNKSHLFNLVRVWEKEVSPHSNNAYKHAAPPGTIKVSIKGGVMLD